MPFPLLTQLSIVESALEAFEQADKSAEPIYTCFLLGNAMHDLWPKRGSTNAWKHSVSSQALLRKWEAFCGVRRATESADQPILDSPPWWDSGHPGHRPAKLAALSAFYDSLYAEHCAERGYPIPQPVGDTDTTPATETTPDDIQPQS